MGLGRIFITYPSAQSYQNLHSYFTELTITVEHVDELKKQS